MGNVVFYVECSFAPQYFLVVMGSWTSVREPVLSNSSFQRDGFCLLFYSEYNNFPMHDDNNTVILITIKGEKENARGI